MQHERRLKLKVNKKKRNSKKGMQRGSNPQGYIENNLLISFVNGILFRV
jgi:hypothetical protein